MLRSLPLLLTLTLALFPLPAFAQGKANLLENADFSQETKSWKLDLLENAQATLSIEDAGGGKLAAVVDVPEATAEAYYINLYQNGLNLESGKRYLLKFRAKASQDITTSVNTLINEAPWQQIWKQDLPLTTDWQEFTMDVIPSESTDLGRFTFGRLGKQAGKYWFADVSLTSVD